MIKVLKISIGVFIVALVGIQFFPIQRNESSKPPGTGFIELYKPTPAVKNILANSCLDCHSNQTKYPWYSHVQPVGLLLQYHIEQGKSELNLSEFGDYSDRMKKDKLRSMISQIEDEEMPLPSYLLIHKEAKLTVNNKEVLLEFLTKLKSTF